MEQKKCRKSTAAVKFTSESNCSIPWGHTTLQVSPARAGGDSHCRTSLPLAPPTPAGRMSGGWGHGPPVLPTPSPAPRDPAHRPTPVCPGTDGEAGLSHPGRRVWPRTEHECSWHPTPSEGTLRTARTGRNSENRRPGKGNYWTSPGEPPASCPSTRLSLKEGQSHLSR